MRWLTSLVLPVLLVAAPARAHDTGPADVVPMLEPLPDALAGVRVQLQKTLTHQLVVENGSGRTLEVLDADGVPFLRLGAAGAEANVAAAEWYRTAGADGAPVPVRATAAEPRWTRVAGAPAWGWFDRRIRPDAVDVPHLVRHVGRRMPVGTWSIAMRIDGEPAELRGRFDYVPPQPGVFRPRLVSRGEVFPGVRVSLLPGPVPALFVENASPQTVTVLGDGDEPFLRIGPDGTPSSRHAWIEPRAAQPGTFAIPLVRGDERAVVRGIVDWVPAPRE